MSKNILLAWFIGLGILIAGCTEEEQAKKVIRPVKVKKVFASDLNTETMVLPASLNELKEVKLAFRVGGPLVKINTILGSYVEKGEVIAKIDPRDFIISKEQAESQYLHAKAEYERYQNLYKKKSVSKSLFDQMEMNYKLSKSSFENAKNALIDTEIKAPFAGYINTVFVENFEKVQPGAPIISLLDISKYEVNAWVSSEDVDEITKETKFIVRVKNGKEHVFNGKLRELGSKTGITKQSYPISVVIDAPANLKLPVGLTAKLEVINGEEETKKNYIIPVSSVFEKETNTCVWLFDGQTNTVRSQAVEIESVVSDHNISIIKGIKNGDLVVTAGVNYLYEGQEVKRMQLKSESNIGNQL